jgi:hypothetical protein
MTKHVAQKTTDNSFVILLMSEVQKSVFEEHTRLLHMQSALNVAQNKTVLLKQINQPDASVRPDRPRPTTLLPPRSNGKPEAATAVDKLLMMGMRMPETCWAILKRQAINLRD